MLQNCQMLPGKVRETVYVEGMPFSKAAFLQLFQQLSLLIPGISFSPTADGIVALQQQRQFLQFLGKAALCPGGRRHQILRCDAATLKFVHSINKPSQKFRLRLHRCISL